MAESSAIESLPIELHYYILRLSPDPPSLRSLALSCRAFYDAFAASEKATTTAVLSRHIHPQVQHEAVATLAASRLPAEDPLAHSTFVAEKLAIKDTSSSKLEWTRADALPAYRLYTHINYFAQALSRQLLSRPPFQTADSKQDDDGADNRTVSTPSTAELHRFERSLYRFEICCSLYKLFLLDDNWDSWSPKLPKFELSSSVASIISLHTLLHLVTLTPNPHTFAARPFNDLVQHDVTWGYFRVDLITDEGSFIVQGVQTRGLETLHALVQAETYDQRRHILHRGDSRIDEPFATLGFLYDLLEGTDDAALITDSPISELPTDEKALALGIPTYPDIPGDPGPSRIFELVHHDSQASELVAQFKFRGYQRWGYVFWDEARLEKLGALTQDGLAKLTAPTNPLEAYQELKNSQLKASRERRSEIWRQGGSGWWSQDDESKVVWPEKKKSAQKKRPLMTARSVQGAKDFLRGLRIPDVPVEKSGG